MNPITIMNNFDTIASIIQTISILMGVFVLLAGFFTLKRFGETRTFMSYHMTFAGPGMMILAGSMLLLLPTIIASLLQTFFSTTSPIAYSPNSTLGYQAYVPVVLMFVRIIGVVSIMRGILLVSRSGGQNSPPGSIGRAMTHIFGGLLAIHIGGTIDILKQILDI